MGTITAARQPPVTVVGVPSPVEPLVLVISAWWDDDGPRARVIHAGTSSGTAATCASLEELLRTVSELVSDWEAAASA